MVDVAPTSNPCAQHDKHMTFRTDRSLGGGGDGGGRRASVVYINPKYSNAHGARLKYANLEY